MVCYKYQRVRKQWVASKCISWEHCSFLRGNQDVGLTWDCYQRSVHRHIKLSKLELMWLNLNHSMLFLRSNLWHLKANTQCPGMYHSVGQ